MTLNTQIMMKSASTTKTLFTCLALGLFAFSCKTTNNASTGPVDFDAMGSKIEELKASAEAGGLDCDGWCSGAQEACSISDAACDNSAQVSLCTDAQETCAAFKDRCASCE